MNLKFLRYLILQNGILLAVDFSIYVVDVDMTLQEFMILDMKWSESTLARKVLKLQKKEIQTLGFIAKIY